MQSIFSLFHFASRIFFSFIFIPHNSLLSITNSVLYILLLFLYLCFFYFQFCLLSTCLFFFTSSSFTFCTQWSRIRHIVATRAHKMYCLHYTNTWIVGLMLYNFFCQDPVYLFLLSYLMSNILYLAISPLYFLFFLLAGFPLLFAPSYICFHQSLIRTRFQKRTWSISIMATFQYQGLSNSANRTFRITSNSDWVERSPLIPDWLTVSTAVSMISLLLFKLYVNF